MKVLVLGATGLLGHKLYQYLRANAQLDVAGSVRSRSAMDLFSEADRSGLVLSGDVSQLEHAEELIETIGPDVVINCIALHKSQWADLEKMVNLFSLLPNRINQICNREGIRFVHISSDGVFSGREGLYREEHLADARDSYGVVKLLGEVKGERTVNLRTSIIGHSLDGKSGLIDWFLTQKQCKGFTRSIFSGLPSCEIAKLVEMLLLQFQDLSGTFHLAAAPISKYDLLRSVSQIYRVPINVQAIDGEEVNRSLIAEKFGAATGYSAPNWAELIRRMCEDHNWTRRQYV